MQLEAGALEEEEAALCSALSRESLFFNDYFSELTYQTPVLSSCVLPRL